MYTSLKATNKPINSLYCKFADMWHADIKNYMDKNVHLGVTNMCWIVSCKYCKKLWSEYL